MSRRLFALPLLAAGFSLIIFGMQPVSRAADNPAQQEKTAEDETLAVVVAATKASLDTADNKTDIKRMEEVTSPFPNPAPPSTRVRITILDKSTSLDRGTRVGMLLGQFRKRMLEQRIGMKIDVSNISSLNAFRHHENVVYYRPGFLHAAMLIAREIPGAQNVAPMESSSLGKNGIDLEIVLGKLAP